MILEISNTEFERKHFCEKVCEIMANTLTEVTLAHEDVYDTLRYFTEDFSNNDLEHAAHNAFIEALIALIKINNNAR
jgi:hypothetical protein